MNIVSAVMYIYIHKVDHDFQGKANCQVLRFYSNVNSPRLVHIWKTAVRKETSTRLTKICVVIYLSKNIPTWSGVQDEANYMVHSCNPSFTKGLLISYIPMKFKHIVPSRKRWLVGNVCQLWRHQNVNRAKEKRSRYVKVAFHRHYVVYEIR